MESEPHGIGRFMGHFDDKSDSSSIGRLIAKQNAYHMGDMIWPTLYGQYAMIKVIFRHR